MTEMMWAFYKPSWIGWSEDIYVSRTITVESSSFEQEIESFHAERGISLNANKWHDATTTEELIVDQVPSAHRYIIEIYTLKGSEELIVDHRLLTSQLSHFISGTVVQRLRRHRLVLNNVHM
eukprot:GHVR01184334.1.p1 GENE.GHVR01184334.1~~GHVR01184334.1.p1  ORF type:complete len:122 (+),score=8.34 GHVR01184334.1:218-583(+)